MKWFDRQIGPFAWEADIQINIIYAGKHRGRDVVWERSVLGLWVRRWVHNDKVAW